MYKAMAEEIELLTKMAEGYLLDQVGKPKIRKFRAEAPREKYRVKQAMSAMDPAKRLAESQKVGVPKMQQASVKPFGSKLAFATSQYSGGPGEGPLRRYASHLPPFRQPQVKTAGPPSEMKKEGAGLSKEEKRNAKTMVTGGALASGGVAAGSLGGLGVSRYLAGDSSAADMSVYNKMVGKAKIPVVSGAAGATTPRQKALAEHLKGSAAFVPQKGHKPVVVIGDRFKGNAAVLGHELGHGSIHNNRFGKLLQNKHTLASGIIGRSAMLGAGLGALTSNVENEHVRRAGRWATAAFAAPQLAYEAGASLIGLRNMHRSGASRRQLIKGAKGLAGAWGTYAARPAIATGASHAAQALAYEKKAMLDEFCKLNNVQSAESQITTSQRVGGPRVTAPPGPSHHQISKPVGYGRALAGTTKTL